MYLQIFSGLQWYSTQNITTTAAAIAAALLLLLLVGVVRIILTIGIISPPNPLFSFFITKATFVCGSKYKFKKKAGSER